MEPDWDLVRRLLVDEESVVPFPYDDNRDGPLRRIDRSEVRREGWRYVVTATGGTATIGAGITNPAIIDGFWDRDMTPAEERAAYDEMIRSYWTEGVDRWLAIPLPSPFAAAALVSLAWNAGVNALGAPEGDGQGYTMARGFRLGLAEGRWADAAALLARSWLKKPGFDLSNRRRREAEVFLTPWVPDDDDWSWMLPLVTA